MTIAWRNEACPFLPEVERMVTHEDVAALGADRGVRFYETALCYAQSLWRSGFPAKAMLICNRAMLADVKCGDAILKRWPLPYRALAWLFVNRPADPAQFFGNPRYHYQHLASRMRGHGSELGVARFWACWYLAKEVLPDKEFPADAKQIRNDALIEPIFGSIDAQLRALSHADDADAWHQALGWAAAHRRPRAQVDTAISIRRIGADELHVVHELAHEIWPRVYPGIITHAQIEHMLERSYGVDHMSAEMAGGVCYALIESGGKAIGYLACEPLAAERVLFIHKLYLHPDWHGIGAGARALEWLQSRAVEGGQRVLRLRVNIHNAPAIRAYLRAGFTFAGEIVTDIGGGFVMDDYQMEKNVG